MRKNWRISDILSPGLGASFLPFAPIEPEPGPIVAPTCAPGYHHCGTAADGSYMCCVPGGKKKKAPPPKLSRYRCVGGEVSDDPYDEDGGSTTKDIKADSLSSAMRICREDGYKGATPL